MTFLHTDVAHDGRTHSLTGGVFAAFGPETRTRTSWGSVSAWAWGASRVLDWIETEPSLDAKHVAVIGHSRCGKTALIAPRLLAIASASCDIPAGPYGEYPTAQLCSPTWELYGKKGLVADPEVEARRGFRGFPPCGTAINAGCVSYHLRRGEHQLDHFDWKCYMDFADRHGWRNL